MMLHHIKGHKPHGRSTDLHASCPVRLADPQGVDWPSPQQDRGGQVSQASPVSQYPLMAVFSCARNFTSPVLAASRAAEEHLPLSEEAPTLSGA